MFKNLANSITFIRILCVPFFCYTILQFTPDQDHFRITALWIFLFAVILDVLDGFIARTFHQRSILGAILDPLADKILMISAFICLYKIGAELELIQFPFWLVALVISRDIILMAGALAIRMIKGDISIHTTILGKLNTFFESLAVLGVLLQLPISALTWYVICVLALWSGTDYLIMGIKQVKHRVKLS